MHWFSLNCNSFWARSQRTGSVFSDHFIVIIRAIRGIDIDTLERFRVALCAHPMPQEQTSFHRLMSSIMPSGLCVCLPRYREYSR